MNQHQENNIHPNRWYKDKQIAEDRNIGRSTLWSWVAQKKFPAPVRIGPRTTRWWGQTIIDHDQALLDQGGNHE